jgi:phosphoribosylanthranilate isomerase
MVVKICGITREEDARAAVQHGATAIGFIFWRRSPRYLPPERARAIAKTLPPFVTPVGVFVNEPAERVNQVADLVGLGAVQLHGDELVEVLIHINRPVIRAVGRIDDDTARMWPERVVLLVDADDRARRGGTGRRADWASAATLARSRRILLAGGLTASNVASAIKTVKPFGLDVSSGVETSPGIKDPIKIREFFEAIRQASADDDVVRADRRAR